MATVVSIPVAEMNEFGLPRVCVMTGSEVDVSFQKEKFSYVPQGIRAAALIPLLYLILASINTRRAVGTLPYSSAGLALKKKTRLFSALSLIAAVFLFFFGVAIVGIDGLELVGLLFFVLSLAVPITVGLVMVRNKLPHAVKIENGIIDLRVPNDLAAKAIVARVGSPQSAGSSYTK